MFIKWNLIYCLFLPMISVGENVDGHIDNCKTLFFRSEFYGTSHQFRHIYFTLLQLWSVQFRSILVLQNKAWMAIMLLCFAFLHFYDAYVLVLVLNKKGRWLIWPNLPCIRWMIFLSLWYLIYVLSSHCLCHNQYWYQVVCEIVSYCLMIAFDSYSYLCKTISAILLLCLFNFAMIFKKNPHFKIFQNAFHLLVKLLFWYERFFFPV